MVRTLVGFHHQVEVDADFAIHMIDLEQYQETVTKETWSALLSLTSEIRSKGVNFAFFSSTTQGSSLVSNLKTMIEK